MGRCLSKNKQEDKYRHDQEPRRTVNGHANGRRAGPSRQQQTARPSIEMLPVGPQNTSPRHPANYQQQQSQSQRQPQSPSQFQALPPPPKPGGTLVRALFDYAGQNTDDLSFSKGDVLEVMGDMDQPWWIARNIKSNDHTRGYIPSNYVVVEDDKPQSMECYFDVSRRDADRHLLLPGAQRGTYLIRPSTAYPSNFALSVREFDSAKQVWVVKHYRIKTLDNDSGYFIASKVTVRTVQELIAYYTDHSDGLCCRLTNPCPRKWVPPPFRDCEVSKKSIELIRKLGNGSFGDVWLAKWNNSFEVAVKMLKGDNMDIAAFLKEAQIMHRLTHPKIVQMLGICTNDEPCYIITELMINGALLSHLRQEGGVSITEDDLIDMMAQITDGMTYLENEKFVHRDLRAANILVGQNNWVKVADFGLARDFAAEDVYKASDDAKFPIKWTAPEAADGPRFFTSKSDVWSFGVLMFEMVTFGGQPYAGMRNREVLDAVKAGYRMPNPDPSNLTKYGAFLYDIMTDCWKTNPADRPTFKSLNDTFENFDTAFETNYLDSEG